MKKIIFWLSTALVFLVPAGVTGALLGVGATRPTQVQFVNYVDYISDEAKSRIRQSYGYGEFSDLPDLRSYIENRQIPAGVGSDYYNVQLANAGLIQKLDFNAIYDGITVNNLTFSKEAPLSRADTATALSQLYTPETWSLLNFFDNQLTNYARGSALWEYMAPYFIQQKVIIYNPYKVSATPGQEAALEALKSYDQQTIDGVFNNDKSYQNILARLSEIGFSSFAVNNYMRDNLAIGSEAAFGVNNFSMNVTSENYPQLVEGYAKVVNTFTGKKYTVDSGYETLSAVHPTGNSNNISADVGLLYNGDALDAFQGSDQVDDQVQNEYNANVRIVVPTNSTFLLDGAVIPQYIGGEDLVKANNTLRYALFENPLDVEDLANNDRNMVYVNFDAVNYTTPFRAVFNAVQAEYFGDLEPSDQNPNNEMTGSGDYAKEIFTITTKIDAAHLTTVIAPNLETVVQSAYAAKQRTLF